LCIAFTSYNNACIRYACDLMRKHIGIEYMGEKIASVFLYRQILVRSFRISRRNRIHIIIFELGIRQYVV
jgi:hypothetical protein